MPTRANLKTSTTADGREAEGVRDGVAVDFVGVDGAAAAAVAAAADQGSCLGPWAVVAFSACSAVQGGRAGCAGCLMLR